MMRKRGESLPFEEGTKAIIAFIVLAIVIFGVVTFLIGSKLSGNGNLLQSVKNILPSFGEQPAIAPGVAIVGIKLDNSIESTPDPNSLTGRDIRGSKFENYIGGKQNLHYYTGTEWVELDEDQIRIEQKIVDGKTIRDALARFYFTTPRFSYLNISLPGYRMLHLSQPLPISDWSESGPFALSGSVRFYDEVQAGYTGPRPQNVYLGLDDRFYLDSRLMDDSSAYDSGRKDAVSWRDQFLSGEPCQKTIELSFSQNGLEETHRYVVVKTARPDGMFIYADLNAPLDNSVDVEKYDSGCFPESSFVEGHFSGRIRIDAHTAPGAVGRFFGATSETTTFIWDGLDPRWQMIAGASYVDLSDMRAGDFRDVAFSNEFYAGLENLLPKLDDFNQVSLYFYPNEKVFWDSSTQTSSYPRDEIPFIGGAGLVYTSSGVTNKARREAFLSRATLVYNLDAAISAPNWEDYLAKAKAVRDFSRRISENTR